MGPGNPRNDNPERVATGADFDGHVCRARTSPSLSPNVTSAPHHIVDTSRSHQAIPIPRSGHMNPFLHGLANGSKPREGTSFE